MLLPKSPGDNYLKLNAQTKFNINLSNVISNINQIFITIRKVLELKCNQEKLQIYPTLDKDHLSFT